jgi:hypothetical protein
MRAWAIYITPVTPLGPVIAQAEFRLPLNSRNVPDKVSENFGRDWILKVRIARYSGSEDARTGLELFQ